MTTKQSGNSAKEASKKVQTPKVEEKDLDKIWEEEEKAAKKLTGDFWDNVQERESKASQYTWINFVEGVTEIVPISDWEVYTWQLKIPRFGRTENHFIQTDDMRMLNVEPVTLQRELKPYAEANLKVKLAITRYRNNNAQFYMVNEVD